MSYFILFLVSVWLGWKLREVTAVRRMTKMMAEAEKKSTEVEKVLVKIEKYGDIFYFFNRETDEFLAQGSSREEITKILADRFKNKNISFHATEDNMNEVDFK